MENSTSILFGLPGVSVREVERAEGGRVVHVVTHDTGAAACPACGVFSATVGQHRITRPKDLGYGEEPLTVKAEAERAPQAPTTRLGIAKTRRGRSRWNQDPDTLEWVKLALFETNFVDLNGVGGLLRAAERLTPKAYKAMITDLTENDPTGQILIAWVAKEELRALLATAKTGGQRHDVARRLDRFYSWCAGPGADIGEVQRLAATWQTSAVGYGGHVHAANVNKPRNEDQSLSTSKNRQRHGGKGSLPPTPTPTGLGSGATCLLGEKSRVTGDCHARVCGSRGVKLPPATRPAKEGSCRKLMKSLYVS